MPSHTVLHIDAFSDKPNQGNPAGVVPDADGLSEREMQAIAKAVGVNETVFVCSSAKADYRFRFFTPGHEMKLCGHATVAATWRICRPEGKSKALTMETLAGVLPISYDAETGMVTMRQAAPEFVAFNGDAAALAAAIGANVSDFVSELPIVYGSTGSWTLLAPVRDEETMLAMKPRNELFPGILAEMPRASVHPFVWERGGADRDFCARHFSSPYSGTVEDPVTGTASGVMGAYALRHLVPEAKSARFVVAQGRSVGRDGKVFVRVDRGPTEIEVRISGQAAFVEEMRIEI